MSHSDQDIPTLTDFIRIGDEDMHHHFDAHPFSTHQDEPWASTDTDASNEDAFSNVDLAGAEADSQTGPARPSENETDVINANSGDSGDPGDFEPLHIAAAELDHVPVELAPFDTALVKDNTPTDETDDYLELSLQEVISPSIPSMQATENNVEQVSAEAIRLQIDQAVDELLPDIAEQLKQNLYRHFTRQSDSD